MKESESTTTPKSYDLIGDIHGYAEPLHRLLSKLGYEASGESFHHPEGRQVVFLGDYIDRGPAIRETLQIVKGMVDAGDALAIMGNHEYNAVCYHTPDGKGDYLRSRTAGGGKNTKQHQTTLDAFADRPDEWNSWIEWFKQLPFSLNLEGLRAVHASWSHDALELLANASLADDTFLKRSADESTKEFEAIETVLKGTEVTLPEGNYFDDKQGIRRTEIRVKWWESPEGKTYRDIVFPDSDTVSDNTFDTSLISPWSAYGEYEPPVFFGHYWLPATHSPAPITPNVACLDYSVAKPGGMLTAYRWEGENVLLANNFISVPQSKGETDNSAGYPNRPLARNATSW